MALRLRGELPHEKMTARLAEHLVAPMGPSPLSGRVSTNTSSLAAPPSVDIGLGLASSPAETAQRLLADASGDRRLRQGVFRVLHDSRAALAHTASIQVQLAMASLYTQSALGDRSVSERALRTRVRRAVARLHHQSTDDATAQLAQPNDGSGNCSRGHGVRNTAARGHSLSPPPSSPHRALDPSSPSEPAQPHTGPAVALLTEDVLAAARAGALAMPPTRPTSRAQRAHHAVMSHTAPATSGIPDGPEPVATSQVALHAPVPERAGTSSAERAVAAAVQAIAEQRRAQQHGRIATTGVLASTLSAGASLLLPASRRPGHSLGIEARFLPRVGSIEHALERGGDLLSQSHAHIDVGIIAGKSPHVATYAVPPALRIRRSGPRFARERPRFGLLTAPGPGSYDSPLPADFGRHARGAVAMDGTAARDGARDGRLADPTAAYVGPATYDPHPDACKPPVRHTRLGFPSVSRALLCSALALRRSSLPLSPPFPTAPRRQRRPWCLAPRRRDPSAPARPSFASTASRAPRRPHPRPPPPTTTPRRARNRRPPWPPLPTLTVRPLPAHSCMTSPACFTLSQSCVLSFCRLPLLVAFSSPQSPRTCGRRDRGHPPHSFPRPLIPRSP